MARFSAAPGVPPPLLELTGLGEPRQYYPHIYRMALSRRLVVALAALLCAALLAFAGITAFQQYRFHGPAAAARTASWPALGGLLCAIIGLAFWLSTRRRPYEGVMVYHDGLAVIAPTGLQKWQWQHWASLAVDRQQRSILGQVYSIRQRYLLVDRMGDCLVLDDRLEGLQDLGVLLEQNILPGLLEDAERRYRAGEMIPFGPLQVQRDHGLQHADRYIPWMMLAQLVVRRGYLEVHLKKGMVRTVVLPVSKLPNLPVLLALVGGHPGVRVLVNSQG